MTKRSPQRVERGRPMVTYVGAMERQIIKSAAQQCNMTVSAYLRAVGLGQRIKPVLDLDAVKLLAGVAAEQKELLALLRNVTDAEKRNVLLGQIDAVQTRMVRAASKVQA